MEALRDTSPNHSPHRIHGRELPSSSFHLGLDCQPDRPLHSCTAAPLASIRSFPCTPSPFTVTGLNRQGFPHRSPAFPAPSFLCPFFPLEEANSIVPLSRLSGPRNTIGIVCLGRDHPKRRQISATCGAFQVGPNPHSRPHRPRLRFPFPT